MTETLFVYQCDDCGFKWAPFSMKTPHKAPPKKSFFQRLFQHLFHKETANKFIQEQVKKQCPKCHHCHISRKAVDQETYMTILMQTQDDKKEL